MSYTNRSMKSFVASKSYFFVMVFLYFSLRQIKKFKKANFAVFYLKVPLPLMSFFSLIIHILTLKIVKSIKNIVINP